MSNGRFVRRGRVYVWDGSEDEHDCPVCRALGQRVEEDGSLLPIEGAPVDQEEAVRLILEHGEQW